MSGERSDERNLFFLTTAYPSLSHHSFVYGNYQLYKLREWSPFTLNIAIVCIVIGVVAYIRNRRHKHRLTKDHKEHIKKFRNSVVLELSSVQLQSKPGQSIKKGSVVGERRRLSVFTEEDEEAGGREEKDFTSSPLQASSPLHPKGRKGAGKGGKKKEKGFESVPLASPGPSVGKEGESNAVTVSGRERTYTL